LKKQTMNTAFCKPLPAILLGLILSLPSLAPTPAAAQDNPHTLERPPMQGEDAPEEKTGAGKVTGKIIGAPEGTDLSTLQVVLLRHRLDAEGKPRSSQVKKVNAGPDGSFSFDSIYVDSQSIYQLGTRLRDQGVGSETFTFPDGEQAVVLNIHFPKLVTDSTGVMIDEALIAVDARKAGAMITEVVHLNNPTDNQIDARKTPFTFSLPTGAEHVNMLSMGMVNGENEQVGDKLLLYGQLKPGRSTIAYRYTRKASLGTFSLAKTYPFETKVVNVLSPQGSIRLGGERMHPQEPRMLENVQYDTWSTRELAQGEMLNLEISGLPAQQELFVIPVAGFLALMAAVVVLYGRRLNKDPEQEEPAAPPAT